MPNQVASLKAVSILKMPQPSFTAEIQVTLKTKSRSKVQVSDKLRCWTLKASIVQAGQHLIEYLDAN